MKIEGIVISFHYEFQYNDDDDNDENNNVNNDENDDDNDDDDDDVDDDDNNYNDNDNYWFWQITNYRLPAISLYIYTFLVSLVAWVQSFDAIIYLHWLLNR